MENTDLDKNTDLNKKSDLDKNTDLNKKSDFDKNTDLNKKSDFDKNDILTPKSLKNNIKIQKQHIILTKKNLRAQEQTLKNNIRILQSICEHNFIRECTTTGPYSEYHNVCQYCDKIC